MLQTILHFPRKVIQLLIRLYQRTLSPDHGLLSHVFRGPTCIYHPTCSQYGYEAIGKYGVFKGGGMTLWRILRCNPWSKGGHDPVT